MRRRIPIVVAASVASFFLLEMFFVHPRIKLLKEYFTDFAMVLVAFATIVMAIEVVHRELARLKLRREYPDWLLSVALLAAFATMAGFGLVGGKSHAAFRWMFDFIYHPLQSSMVALVAFTITVALVRVARARPREAAALFVAAGIVMVGRIPVGNWASPWIPEVGEWLASVPAVGVRRALLLGAAVGAIGMFLRVVLGLDGVPVGQAESEGHRQ